MGDVHNSIILFARQARRENKAVESMVKSNPQFLKARGKLITIIGRC